MRWPNLRRRAASALPIFYLSLFTRLFPAVQAKFHQFQLSVTSGNYFACRAATFFFSVSSAKIDVILTKVFIETLSKPVTTLINYDKRIESANRGRKSLSISRICNFYERSTNVASITNEPVGERKSRWRYSAESSLFSRHLFKRPLNRLNRLPLIDFGSVRRPSD